VKTLGIFIATPGRKSLWRTLHSIAYQRVAVEDVLVVGDGYHAPTAELVRVAAEALCIPARYVATTKTRDFGHSQQNYALKHVRGDFLIYQDDDDIFLPRSLSEALKLMSAMDQPHPLVGRVKTPNHGLLWQTLGTDAVLDGHCIVVPNDKKRLGWFAIDYSGDQGYIHTCMSAYKECAWTDRIWTLSRPHWKLWPDWATEGNTTWACDLRRDNEGLPGEVVAAVLLEVDDTHDIWHATIDTRLPCTYMEYQEIAEFIMYAAQSKDIRLRCQPEEALLRQALENCNYKEHIVTEKFIEYSHDWPPDFWAPFGRFNSLMDQHGNVIPDWRDPYWGSRRQKDE